MNSISFDRVLRRMVFLPLLTLLLCVGALFWQVRSTSQTLAAVRSADERLRQTTEILKLILDEETGLRGYQITRDTQFLEPYNMARARLPQRFAARRGLALSPGRASLIDDLQTAHDAWQQNFAEAVIAAIKAGGRVDDVALNLEGKRQMDALRRRVDAINQSTIDSRELLNQRWQHQVRIMFLSTGAAALLFGLLFGLYMRGLMRAVSRAFRQSHDVLHQRAEEAFRSEEKLRITLQSIGDAVITCAVDGRIDSMNSVAEALTGWYEAEARGLPLEEVFRIVEEGSRAPLENPVSKVKRLDRVVALAEQAVLVRRDGSEIFVDDSGAPIRDKNSSMVGVVLVFRDVTLARRSQQALIANEKLAVAGRLAATIAHEIHNPLDSIANLLFLMDGQSSPEESAQFLQMAREEITRVTQISRSMLSLYRESRSPVAIDLKEMLDSVLLLLERRFQQLKVTVTAELAEGLVVYGFPAELRQVFTNLLVNAAEAAGEQAEVHLFARRCPAVTLPDGLRQEAGIAVTVQDFGAGISDDVLDKLFQPFFTTKGERGTGLGLWVSRGIMTKHGGSLQLASSTAAEDHGTRATVFIAYEPVLTRVGD